MTAKLSLGLEYLHTEIDGVVATGEAANIPGAFPRFEGDINLDTVRLA